jgi:hypothetical protein
MKRIATVVLLLAFAAGAAAWRLADVKPDPNVQAIADGCQRDTTKIYTGFAPNWVYVNDRDFPSSGPPPSTEWVSGTVRGATGLLASRIASSDDPITHHSYDVNIDLTVDPPDEFLTGTSRDATAEQGEIHMERESASYPAWTRPAPGDHVQALGSWVWDCDHYLPKGEKTDFQPSRASWDVRARSPLAARLSAEGDLYVSTDATPAGREAECAHVTKGSDAFKSCAHSTPDWLSVNGAYAFDLAAASSPCARPALRTVDRGSIDAPKVAARGTGQGWHVTFAIAAAQGTRVVVARRLTATCANAPALDHLRLHFDRLLVRRAMDPSCAPDKPSCPAAGESTLLGQIATGPGEWQLEWSVDGIWGRWPGTLAASDNSTFAGKQSVDFYVQRGKPWTLVTLARECDFGALPGWDGVGHPTLPCPVSNEVGNSSGDDYPGAIGVTFRGPALGRHRSNASLAGSTCPPSNVHGCYELTYTVSRVR